jgi:GNAT superfamily N-acetyltransferase
MQVYITGAWSETDLRAVQLLEEEVFRREMGINLPAFHVPEQAAWLRLVARLEPDGKPVGTVTVLETTGDHDLHRSSGLTAPASTRIARYTRLAVLPQHRGYGLSLRLMLEANERFAVPNGIDTTWLLFDARRAQSSLMVSILRFHCGTAVIRSEYGACRVLSRNERGRAAIEGTRRGWAFVARHQKSGGEELARLTSSSAMEQRSRFGAQPDYSVLPAIK